MNGRALGVVIALAYPAWLAMMALHEAGHVLHAWLSGGRVQSVSIPLLGSSYSALAFNPHPLFVAWGGFIWGCLIPVAAALVLRGRPRAARFRASAQAFAGFCLICNGVYLGVGVFDSIGDAGDLRRHGVHHWLVAAVGAVAAGLGLWLWHDVSRRRV
jgi:hypothetical protein